MATTEQRAGTRAAPSWSLVRVAWDDERAVRLRGEMDDELRIRYAGRERTMSEAERIARTSGLLVVDPATLVTTLLAIDDADEPVAHLALRRLTGALADSIEIKRLFIRRTSRGTGLSVRLMREAEHIARGEGARRIVLQTGNRQPDAVALYEKLGYTRIPLYPPYLDLPNSHCFELPLTA